MRYERTKALEAFEECVRTARDAGRTIRRLEQEESRQNIGFDMLETALPDVQALGNRLHEVRTMWANDAPKEAWQIEDESRENSRKQSLDDDKASSKAYEAAAAAIHRLIRDLEKLEQDKDSDLLNVGPMLRDFLLSAGGHGPRNIDLQRLTNFLTREQLNDAGTTIAAGGWAVNVVSEWVKDRQSEELTATM